MTRLTGPSHHLDVSTPHCDPDCGTSIFSTTQSCVFLVPCTVHILDLITTEGIQINFLQSHVDTEPFWDKGRRSLPETDWPGLIPCGGSGSHQEIGWPGLIPTVGLDLPPVVNFTEENEWGRWLGGVHKIIVVYHMTLTRTVCGPGQGPRSWSRSWWKVQYNKETY
jgi:hypothetical protein